MARVRAEALVEPRVARDRGARRKPRLIADVHEAIGAMHARGRAVGTVSAAVNDKLSGDAGLAADHPRVGGHEAHRARFARVAVRVDPSLRT